MPLIIEAKRIGSLCAAPFALFAMTAFGQQDPPSRVARLNYINGQVSMEPAGIDQWTPAAVNRPFTTGDYLYADQKSVAELHLDVAAIRIGEVTSFGFLNLDDQVVQLKLTEGDMYFRIHDLGENQTFEVDTPNAAIALLRDGVYRINVDPNANSTFVVVRTGQAEITGGGQAFTLTPGNGASLSGTDQLAYDVRPAPAADAFDNWCEQRDGYETRSQSARYVPPTVIGSEDLGDNGVWNETPDYGPVWYPRQVDAGWAPYRDGHWAWIEPWGWTWVDDEPWGFAPFHYGRWVYWHERWGWAPGPIAVAGFGRPFSRPVYSPALVAWFGGSHWGVSIGFGGGPSLGWVPLGFGEVFTPHYACSRQYFSNVNINNTRIERNVNITNVYNTVYVNHTVYNQNLVNVRSPNAVVAMPQSEFASGGSVRRAGTSVSPNVLARFKPAESLVTAPAIAPTRQAVAPSLGAQAAHPSPQIMQRQVLARTAPPAAPPNFAARQSYLQQHAGQVHSFAAMHQAITPSFPRQVAQVRQIPAQQAVVARPGRSVHTGPQDALATRPTVQPPPQPNRPNVPAQGFPAPQQAHQALPPPAAHGTPPNMRSGYGAQANSQAVNRPNEREGQPTQNEGRVGPRLPEQPRAAEQSRPAEQPRYQAPPRSSAYESPRPVEQPRNAAPPPRPVEPPQTLEQPRPAEQPRYQAPPRQPAYESPRPVEQPRNVAPPPRPVEPRQTLEQPRPAEQPRYQAPPRQPAYESPRPSEQPRNVAPPPRAVEPRRNVEPPPVERSQPEARPQSRPEPHGEAHSDTHHEDKK